MKAIKLVNLFILTLFCQVVFSQNSDMVKSFNWRMDKSSEKGLDGTNIAKALIIQLEIPDNYEFERQIIKGTKGRMSEKDDLGYIHERYAQYYKGIKIENSDIRVRYLNGLFVSAHGEYIDTPNIDTSVVLSKEKAIEKAKEYIGAKEYIWEDEAENNWLKKITNDETASFYPKPEIVICKNSIDFQDTTFHIAYKMDVYAKNPMRRDYIFVDASTGNILAVNPILVNVIGTAATRYSGNRSISTQQNGSTYRLRGYDDNRSIETYNMKKGTSYAASDTTDFTDNNNDWTAAEHHNANKDDGALDAHWGAMMTHDYFKNIHGRNSYDNNGAVLRNYVHANLVAMNPLLFHDNDNAFWNGLCMTYGDGTYCDIVTSLDIIAHEIGHGVCEYTANLVYLGESGAINESLSDIWGACVEYYAAPDKQTWLMGEDVCTLRSLSNPKQYNCPDTYEGTYWINPSSSYDNGGVHFNSGVMNHWFYILSIGKSGQNDKGHAYNVTGIGINKAERIVYIAETNMTSGTNFANARTRTIEAAINDLLYEDCSPEVVAVTNAWHAVGVGDRFIIGPNQVGYSGNQFTIDTSRPPNTIIWSVTGPFMLKNNAGNPITVYRTGSETISGTLTASINGTVVDTRPISPCPPSTIYSAGDEYVCANTTFTVNSGTVTSWSLTPGSVFSIPPNSNSQTVVVSVPADVQANGSAILTAVIDNGGSISKLIRTCNISGSQTVCPSWTYALTTNEPATWSLSNVSGGTFSLSPSGAGESVTVTANAPINYQTATLKAVVTGNGRTHTYPIGACYLGIMGPSYVCSPVTYDFYSGQSAYWSVSSGFSLSSSTGASTTVTATSHTGQSGTLTAVVNGVTHTKTIYSCSISGPYEVCPSETYSLISGESANWSVSSGFSVSPSTGVSTTVTASSQNGQSGTLTATLSGGGTVSRTIYSCPPAGVSIDGSDNVCYSGYTTYTLTNNGQAAAWTTSGPFTISSSGATSATVTTSASNGENGAIIAIMGPSGAISKPIYATCGKGGSSSGNETDLNAYVSAYPNPVSHLLNVEIDAAAHILDLQANGVSAKPSYDVRLFDGMGNAVRNQRTKDGRGGFNVANLTSGIYYLIVCDDLGSAPAIRRIVVVR